MPSREALPCQRSPLSDGHRRLLLDLAAASIRFGLAEAVPLEVDLAGLPEALAVPCASFVTLRLDGELRGCVGRLEAVRPMAQDVADNAFAAAFLDRRFPPVTADEVDRLELALSLLTPARPIDFATEAELIAQLVPGRDGVILERGCRRATFLPEMWDVFPAPAVFLQRLRAKGGLGGPWAGIQGWRYGTERFGRNLADDRMNPSGIPT
jgi:hypothetical protein